MQSILLLKFVEFYSCFMLYRMCVGELLLDVNVFTLWSSHSLNRMHKTRMSLFLVGSLTTLSMAIKTVLLQMF